MDLNLKTLNRLYLLYTAEQFRMHWQRHTISCIWHAPSQGYYEYRFIRFTEQQKEAFTGLTVVRMRTWAHSNDAHARSWCNVRRAWFYGKRWCEESIRPGGDGTFIIDKCVTSQSICHCDVSFSSVRTAWWRRLVASRPIYVLTGLETVIYSHALASFKTENAIF